MAQDLPPPTMHTMISTFAGQAAVALGQIANPVTNKKERDLPQAKFAIDMLEVLQRKTKGNLDDEERKFLDDCLYHLRMLYIDGAK